MDLQTVFAAIFFLSLGAVYGIVMGRWSVRPSAQPVFRCGCGHSYAMHDLTEATCMQELRRPHYSSTGRWLGVIWVRCGCRHYTGEDPYGDSELEDELL